MNRRTFLAASASALAVPSLPKFAFADDAKLRVGVIGHTGRGDYGHELGRGKGDRRGGAEDLWVLGSHVLNLINYFGGKPLTCSAVMLQNGKRVTNENVRDGAEGLGPLAGNELPARYQMERGFTAYFDSIANDESRNAGFGLQLIGSKGIISIHADRFPLAHFMRGNPFESTDKARHWVPVTSSGADVPEPIDGLENLIGHHITPARDLVASIREDREPLCGMDDATTTVEMICAVFASHVQQSRAVSIPLENRENALATW